MLLDVTDAGKNQKKKARQPRTTTYTRKRTDQASAILNDAHSYTTWTLAEWTAASPEVLRLIATDHHITHAPPQVLATILFNYFQRHSSSAPTTVTASSFTSGTRTLPLTTPPATNTGFQLYMPSLLPVSNQGITPIPLSRNPFLLSSPPGIITSTPNHDSSFQLASPIDGRSLAPLHHDTHIPTSLPLPTPPVNPQTSISPPVLSYGPLAATATSPPTTAFTTAPVSTQLPPGITPPPSGSTDPSTISYITSLHDSLMAQNTMLFDHLQSLNHRLLEVQQSHDQVIASINNPRCSTDTTTSTIDPHRLQSLIASAPRPSVPPPTINYQPAVSTTTTASCPATWYLPSNPQESIVSTPSTVTPPTATAFITPTRPTAHAPHLQIYDDSVYRLPSIPEELMTKIKAGKYVDLAKLTPRAAMDARESIQMLVDADDESGRTRVNVLPGEVRSSRIQSFHEWLAAFLIFAQAYLPNFPDKAPGVFAYIAQITRYSTRYPLKAVLSYDKKFRMRIAQNHPTSFWGVVDDISFDEYLGGRIIPASSANPAAPSARADLSCFRCGILGHLASACPSAPTPAQSSVQSTATTHSPAAPPPFRAPQRWPIAQRPTAPWQAGGFRTPRPSSFTFTAQRAAAPATGSFICHAFTNYGVCSRPHCNYAHVCATCHRPGHNAAQCTPQR